MSLVGKTSLRVIVDSPTPRAMVGCKPYKARLTLEACAKRSKAANSTRAGNMAPDAPLAVSACRNCQIGIATRHVMKRHGLSVKIRAHYQARNQREEDRVL